MIRIPHLETDITTACQLSCVACNHHVPLWRVAKGGPWIADPVQVRTDCENFGRIAHADVWGALGGEPLLHPRLTDILHVVRYSGIADTLEVWTNGLALPKMKSEFWKAFDILVLSVYEGKHTDASLNWIAKKCLDSGVQLVVKDERTWKNFRTLLEPMPTDEATTQVKYNGCFFRQFSRVLNFGHFFTCCCAPHMPMLIQNRPFGSDGLPMTTETTEADLRAYLSRPEPLGACAICAGRDTAKSIEWSEVKSPLQWMRASAGLV